VTIRKKSNEKINNIQRVGFYLQQVASEIKIKFFMNKNILEVCLSPDFGGLELFSVHCYETFKNKTLCKIAVAPEKKLDKYLDAEDKIYIQRSKFFPLRPAFSLAKQIDAYDIDIVHFHWTKDIITVVLAKLLSKKKPKVVQSRHMVMTRFKDDFYHRWIYKNVDMIHAVTKEVKKQLIKYIPAEISPKIELVYLGVKEKNRVDLIAKKKEYSITDNDFVVGIIGRIQEGKDQHVVIEALGELKELDIKLFVIGDSMDDEYLKRLHTLCEEMKLEERVYFTGFTKEVDAYMQLCDVTVLATTNETFGLVIIESMANGTPVIATDRGGPLEIIDDNVDGLLYDGSSKDLAKKIKYIYNNKELKKSLIQESAIKVKNKFDFDRQLEKFYQIIREV
jgi:glycosyltransferase involved in cell wall biosynthesis